MEYAYKYDAVRFGEKIRDIRKANGLTQGQLAEKLLLSVDSISNIENGKTTCMPEHLIKICQIFNISADYFYFDQKRELNCQTDNGIDKIMNILSLCSEHDLSRITRMIQILLESPAA